VGFPASNSLARKHIGLYEIQFPEFLAATVLLLAPMAPAQSSTTWTFNSNHSQATFVVKHMSVTTVRGAISHSLL
jgi:polyisoprenoid-binding protein YceI